MSRTIIDPIEVLPDSSEFYHLKNLLKKKELFATIDMTEQNTKRLIDMLVLIEEIRKPEPVNRLLKKEIKIAVNKLAKQILTTKKMEISKRNKLIVARPSELRKTKKKSMTKYGLTEVILHVLYANKDKPVNGRIAITKQIFLAIKEIFTEEKVEKANFIPYQYGPYSFLVTQILTNLQYDGLIQTSGQKNSSNEKFRLTENGKKIVGKRFQRLPKQLKTELIERRKGWDESHTDGILGYVYDRYPEYTEKSRIRKRYHSIKWGRARG